MRQDKLKRFQLGFGGVKNVKKSKKIDAPEFEKPESAHSAQVPQPEFGKKKNKK